MTVCPTMAGSAAKRRSHSSALITATGARPRHVVLIAQQTADDGLRPEGGEVAAAHQVPVDAFGFGPSAEAHRHRVEVLRVDARQRRRPLAHDDGSSDARPCRSPAPRVVRPRSTRRSGWRGRGAAASTPRRRPRKSVVFAPMPMASDSAAVTTKSGLFLSNGPRTGQSWNQLSHMVRPPPVVRTTS